jgi:hypothetical protein
VRNLFCLIVLLVALNSGPVNAGQPYSATLYKNHQCGCCETYADYLRENGFEVTVKPTHDLPLMKRQYGVPGDLEGCHTTLVDGYVVEGHVPVNTLLRLLTERPDIKRYLPAWHADGVARHDGREDRALHDL